MIEYLIARIDGLDSPTCFQISIKNEILFFIPNDLLEKKNEYLNNLHELKDAKKRYPSIILACPPFRFNKNRDKFTLIFLKWEPRDPVDRTELLSYLNKMFETLLLSLSFLFTGRFRINEAYIFSKKNGILLNSIIVTVERVPSVLDSKLPPVLLDDMIPFGFSCSGVKFLEDNLNHLVECIENQPSYKRILNELIIAKTVNLAEIQISNLWNCIEHISWIYSQQKGYNLIISERNLKILQENMKKTLENELHRNPDFPQLPPFFFDSILLFVYFLMLMIDTFLKFKRF